MTTGETKALTIWAFVNKVIPLLFNVLSRFIIAFLPRSKHLLPSWQQSPSWHKTHSEQVTEGNVVRGLESGSGLWERNQQGIVKQGAASACGHEVTRGANGFPGRSCDSRRGPPNWSCGPRRARVLTVMPQGSDLLLLLPPVSYQSLMWANPNRNWKVREPSSLGPQSSVSGSTVGWESEYEGGNVEYPAHLPTLRSFNYISLVSVSAHF